MLPVATTDSDMSETALNGNIVYVKFNMECRICQYKKGGPYGSRQDRRQPDNAGHETNKPDASDPSQTNNSLLIAIYK